jgi:hypothetical protein
LHAEEGTSHIHHFPGEEQGKPGQARESRGTRPEHRLTRLAKRLVAVAAELAVAETKDDEGEGSKAESRDPEAIHDHVNEEFVREDTFLERLRGAAHDIRDSTLESETHVRHPGRRHDDPDDLNGRQGEDGESTLILEGKTYEKRAGLGYVF